MTAINHEQLEAELADGCRRGGSIPMSITQWAFIYAALQSALRREDVSPEIRASLTDAANTIRALCSSSWGPQTKRFVNIQIPKP